MIFFRYLDLKRTSRRFGQDLARIFAYLQRTWRKLGDVRRLFGAKLFIVLTKLPPPLSHITIIVRHKFFHQEKKKLQ